MVGVGVKVGSAVGVGVEVGVDVGAEEGLSVGVGECVGEGAPLSFSGVGWNARYAPKPSATAIVISSRARTLANAVSFKL